MLPRSFSNTKLTKYYLCTTVSIMNYTSTVTQKGQTTIPLHLRKKLGIKPKSKIRFVVNDKDEVVIKPLSDFFSFQGSLKSKKKFDIDAMDKAIGNYINKDYEKKHY